MWRRAQFKLNDLCGRVPSFGFRWRFDSSPSPILLQKMGYHHKPKADKELKKDIQK